MRQHSAFLSWPIIVCFQQLSRFSLCWRAVAGCVACMDVGVCATESSRVLVCSLFGSSRGVHRNDTMRNPPPASSHLLGFTWPQQTSTIIALPFDRRSRHPSSISRWTFVGRREKKGWRPLHFFIHEQTIREEIQRRFRKQKRPKKLLWWARNPVICRIASRDEPMTAVCARQLRRTSVSGKQ